MKTLQRSVEKHGLVWVEMNSMIKTPKDLEFYSKEYKDVPWLVFHVNSTDELKSSFPEETHLFLFRGLMFPLSEFQTQLQSLQSALEKKQYAHPHPRRDEGAWSQVRR
jgi:hypothetical protein